MKRINELQIPDAFQYILLKEDIILVSDKNNA